MPPPDALSLIELLQMQSYPKFHNEIWAPIVRIGCREFECIGAMPPQITHSFTSIWAMPVTSSAPIALRCSISIAVWAPMKLIRQIVLTVTWTEPKKQQFRFSRRFRTQPMRGLRPVAPSFAKWRSQCV